MNKAVYTGLPLRLLQRLDMIDFYSVLINCFNSQRVKNVCFLTSVQQKHATAFKHIYHDFVFILCFF